jgi:hypothetical protein
MAQNPVRLKGYREFQRAVRKAPKDTRTELRGAFREIGDIVKSAWSNRLGRIDERSARGLRTSVTTKGIVVRQSLRKTTGKRPDFGALQMRYGLEEYDRHRRQVEGELERALDRIGDDFER